MNWLRGDELRDVELFLLHEARLLDEQRFDEWLELFADDGVYWLPSEPGQPSADAVLSLIHEDKPGLRLRVRRLLHPQMHVQAPAARTHHHLGSIMASSPEPAGLEVHSMLLLALSRSGSVEWFSARCSHWLRRTGAGLKIRLKRVDLINCDAPLRAIAVPF